MAGELAVNVAVRYSDGSTVLWRKGETPPPELAEYFGAHCWADGVDVLTKAGQRSVSDVKAMAGRGAPAPVVKATEPAPEPAPEAFTEAEQEPETDSEPREGEPPRSGPGAGRAAWLDYAASLGQDMDSALGRDQVIAHLVDAGLIDP